MTPQLSNRDFRRINEELRDRAIRHAILVSRLQDGEARRIARQLEFAFEDLTGKTVARLVRSRGFEAEWLQTQQFQNLIASINSDISGIFQDIRGDSANRLEEVARREAEWQNAVLQEHSPVAIGRGTPNIPVLRSVVRSRPFQGRLLREWWQGLESGTKQSYKQAVNIGLTLGESNEEIAARVARDLRIKARQAATVTRTAVSHVTTRARAAVYEQYPEIIKAVQYVATLDAKTTFICMSLDGRVFPVRQGERPPMHHQCRSTTVPLFSDKPISEGTRASKDGPVPAKTTFHGWLKQQPNSVRVEALGKRRAELFNQNKIRADQLVNSKHQILTLEQLTTE